MPFTVSHTVAAFPIHRYFRKLPLDALMIGATGPDLEYFYNLRVHGKYWHSFEGLILGAIPVCLLLILLWRKAVYPALLALLPHLREQGRLPQSIKASALYTLLASFIGGITHIVWDGFTHDTGMIVEAMPFLLYRLPYQDVHGWLQDMSTLFGLIVIGVMLRKVWREYRPSLSILDRHRLIVVGGAIAFVSIVGGVINAMLWHDERTAIILGQFAIGGMAAFVVFTAIASAIILLVRYRLYQRDARTN